MINEARFHDQRYMNRALRPEKGDVLLNSTGTGTIGRSCVFHAHGDFLIDGHITLLRPDLKKLDGRWLNCILQSPEGQLHLETQCYSGSTNQVELSRERLMATAISLPPLPEQHRIAEILDTIDEAIKKTEALIEKLKAMKQGLLHDLLTRGLDENGKLRDPKTHPEQFKKTDIGWLPSPWDVKKIEEIKADSPNALSMGPFGSNITVKNFINEGVPVIRGINLSGPIVDFSNTVYISDKKADELSSSNVFWNDIVITHRGTVGQVSLFKEKSPFERAVVSQSQLKISCNSAIIRPYFLTTYLTSAFGQKLISNAKGHTGVQAIGQPLSSVKKMKIPAPPLHEQQRIESILIEWGERINREERYCKKLMKIKGGLMHDLLTGEVRVKVDTPKEKTPS